MPLAALCAERLANTGFEVVVATSTDPSDDLLAMMLEDHGLVVFRGDLDGVLDRFLACTQDLSPGDLVVRATADNPLPDGELVNRLVNAFEDSAADYCATPGIEAEMPYGLSAEVMTVVALRAVALKPHNPVSREHVTTDLRAQAGTAGIAPRSAFLTHAYPDCRVTIDTLEDYLLMAHVFRSVEDPVMEPYETILEAF